jgi:hypothetical protein
MVAGAVAHPAATTELDMTIARNRPSGEIAPRRGNVHDVGYTVTHERIICRTVLRGSWQRVANDNDECEESSTLKGDLWIVPGGIRITHS